ncbi:MAG: hypothetical protein QOH61_2510 [Chloroflexota bacterium]|jgi:hypothetical protein|nr:hypothetical protein [Chloroflexota bacterium]
MSSLVLDVLKAWREALHFMEENPSSPMRDAVERRTDELRSVYQQLASEDSRLPQTAADAELLIRDTRVLLGGEDASPAASEAEQYETSSR